MPEKIYSFNGKDITMNVCIQIRDVVKLLQEHFQIPKIRYQTGGYFREIREKNYHSCS